MLGKESIEQIKLFQICSFIPECKFMFAVPNGGSRNKIEAYNLKRQGLKSGVPDILACINGYFVGIEVKAPNGKPSDLQIYNVNVINRRGGYAVILYPKDFGLFKQLTNCLNNHDKKGARKLVHIINNEERRNKVG